MVDFRSECRFVMRGLLRSRGFAVLAVLTLGVGIGGTTALFSMVDAVLLKSLPYRDSDRLVEIWGQQGERTGMRVPGEILTAFRERASTLEAVATHGPSGAVWRTAGEAIGLRGDHVSANFLDVLGVSPLLGRGFAPGDDRAGAPPLILLSFGLWQQRLRADPGVVGRSVDFDGTVYTVIGVMPADFQTQFRGPVQDFWTTHVDERTRAFEAEDGFELIARLASDATVDEARREIVAIAGTVGVEGWGADGRRPGLVRLIDEVVRDSAYVLKLLLAAVLAVLAIACANLAQLMLARSDRRVSEFATRKAMGATTGRLFRLALVESLILSATSAAVGIMLAYWLLPVLLSLAPAEIPRLAEATIDARVLGLAIGLAFVTGCLFGVAPALRLSRLSIVDAIRQGGLRRAPGRARFHSGLVVLQVSASVALFTLSALLLQTFLTLMPTDPGFQARSRSIFGLSLNPALFADAQARRVRIGQLLDNIEAHPRVSGVAIASNIPFSSDEYLVPVFDVDDAGAIDSAGGARADVRAISINYFELLEMSMLSGRPFNDGDTPESPLVAIVNQRLSRSLAGGSDIRGRRVRIGTSGAAPVYEVVGVISDARSTGTSVEALNEIYVPFAQSLGSTGLLIVESSASSSELTEIVRNEVRSVLPELPLRRGQAVTPFTELIRRSLARQRFAATLVSVFSGMALLLAISGVFGLVSYSISQRKRELGVRAALGARPRDLGMTTVRPVLVLTLLGIALGAMTAAYVTRFVQSQLEGVEPVDLPILASTAIGMFVVAGVAALIPARHAMTADPGIVLRHE